MNSGNGPFISLGLIGYPLGHSLSPILHQAALESAGLQGEYRLYAVPPSAEGEVEMHDLCTHVRCGMIKGLNVTIPHKQTIRRYMDQLTLTAQAVGAVNTIYLDKNGILVGDNTDVGGFCRDIFRLTGGEVGKALILGAGGSARAVVCGLCRSGWDVMVLARRCEQAAKLIQEIKSSVGIHCSVAWGEWNHQTLNDLSTGCHLLVNATPLGMFPNEGSCPWPDDVPLPAQAKVYDLVYNPLETRLIQRARRERLSCSNGAGMLVAQAALAFSSWTELDPPFDVMERAFPAQIIH